MQRFTSTTSVHSSFDINRIAHDGLGSNIPLWDIP